MLFSPVRWQKIFTQFHALYFFGIFKLFIFYLFEASPFLSYCFKPIESAKLL